MRIVFKCMSVYNLDEEAKAQKFLGGLKLEIQLALSSLGAHTYAEVVSQALVMESNLNHINGLGMEFWEPEERELGKRHDLGVRIENFKPKRNYPKCQKFHPAKPCEERTQGCYTCGMRDHIARDCPKGPRCFRCHQVGHFSRDCPQRREVNQSRTNQGGREPQRGHVFQLSGNDVDANPTIVQGTSISPWCICTTVNRPQIYPFRCIGILPRKWWYGVLTYNLVGNGMPTSKLGSCELTNVIG